MYRSHDIRCTGHMTWTERADIINHTASVWYSDVQKFGTGTCTTMSCDMHYNVLRHALQCHATCTTMSCDMHYNAMRHALQSRATCTTMPCDMHYNAMRHALQCHVTCTTMPCDMHYNVMCHQTILCSESELARQKSICFWTLTTRQLPGHAHE